MGFGNRLQKASPTILTLLGVGGVVATAVLTARAVPKAEQRRKDAEEESKSELTVVEIVKAEAPAYAPAAMVGIGTIVCIFGANMLNRRQQASLASAYALMERTFHQYKDKVKAIFGEEGNHIVECAMEEENREIEEEQPPCKPSILSPMVSSSKGRWSRFFRRSTISIGIFVWPERLR